jgi:cysteine-S-conjugate beta-lyase
MTLGRISDGRRRAEDFIARRARYLYGRRGSPTSEALADALREIEGPNCVGLRCYVPDWRRSRPRSVLNAGDHVLVADNVYQPTRRFCDGVLTRYGIHHLLRPVDRCRHYRADAAAHARGG